MNTRCFTVFVVLATTAFACAGSDDGAPETSGADLTSSRNHDVQVLDVVDAPTFSISKASMHSAFDQEECIPEGKTWDEIKGWDAGASGYLPVKLDCTAAFVKKFGFPSMRAVTAEGARTRPGPEEKSYGYVGFPDGHGTFWTKTVALVVKQTVIDSPSFQGIGFHLNAFAYAAHQAPPEPGENNGNALFVSADQVRAQAEQHPAATLPSGDKVRLIKVLLAAEYPPGGTSRVPGFYFRPFAEYLAGAEKVRKWDPVARDYFVNWQTQFNREGDVLAR